ncbi:Rrf2 family transcriptional regulator [Nonlabens sp. Ci31]|jgi:Rrf2 family protein|uniref:RrF2 family transcriptional regulator n=1 Tax=Nonlabens sp. Ci31 TaxID=2608253 RepID=UPI001463B11C|nr:Rrf2 family transcriptional regulator [Nonlabens sp. Ci31]QJP34229.1 Rrf2 family transcriptional regulator [Nonlabens sp. Ci31]
MLSRKTKYGIKALAYLAKLESQSPTAIATIADAENIPHKFLEAILLELRKNSILGSRKGKGGGYYLMQSPEKIRMSTVHRILEGPIAMLPCVSLNFYEKCEDCLDEDACSVNRLMVQVRDNTLAILENQTLQDLL